MKDDEYGWSWWVGYDEERYHTECATRDEAVRIASEEQYGGYIVEARKPDLKISRFFDGESFAEDAEEEACEEHGDPETGDPVFDLTPDQIKDLQATVRAAIDAWQEKHCLTFTGFMFSETRNHEHIPAKADPAGA